MRTTRLTRFARSKWSRVVCLVVFGVVVLFIAVMPSAQTGDPLIKVMKVGLGSGTITSTDGLINCGDDCDENYPSTTTVNLRAATSDSVSTFSRWLGDCTGTDPMVCSVSVASAHWVKAEFTLTTATATDPVPPITDLTPDGPTGAGGIRRYLIDHPEVTTPARFIAALPLEFRQNWILMSRSESLQTGTAESPRVLLPSADGTRVFTIGMTQSSSYPGAHPDAIEYMQWDPAQKNFRFHEIVLNPIDAMGETLSFPDGTTGRVFPLRDRKISIDDEKCSRCHSTRNVLNIDRRVSPAPRGPLPGTDIVPPGTAVPATTVMAKNKPNWDTYDSWGGMLPFNRDRIFHGSLEAAAIRNILNLWNWRTNDRIRSVIEQLQLQPGGIPGEDAIVRTSGGPNDGQIGFFFDHGATITTEPTPSGSPPFFVNYSFDRILGAGAGTPITRGGESVLMQHSTTPGSTGPLAEGRGVQLFDLLGGGDGSLNSQRIADELSTHRYAPGSVPIDVRPIALAIVKNCFSRSGDNVTSTFRTPALDTGLLDFFRARNGNLTLSQFFSDTLARAKSIPRRKADIERLNLDRTQFDGSLDPYLATRPVPTPTPKGLLQQYGASTTLTTTGVERARQEVFRRPPDTSLDFRADTVIGGVYVDREDYSLGAFNTEKMTLYRYFLEPLGVSVDKWSMGVRGRSRTYSFADIFNDSITTDALRNGLEASLTADRFGTLGAPFACGDLMNAVNDIFRPLPPDGSGLPTYTDVQRIFNKSCIECHGGLFYPPYGNLVFPTGMGGSYTEFDHFDLTEEEYPPKVGRRRMERSHQNAVRHIGATDETAELFRRINGTSASSEDCPGLFMPCGGPWLNQADVGLILRWIRGGHPYSEGDPHIRTIDGLNYDFQSAGEFVLLRGENLEIQTRQIPIDTGTPLGPNEHTGLSSCVSINGAVAVRIDGHRITYQPNISGEVDPSGLQLRIDGKLTNLTAEGVPVTSGVRVMPTTAPGGIRIEAPGGTAVIVTPHFWDYWQVWQTDINIVRVRATEGLMGAVAPGSWLPALPDGSSLGPKPAALSQRYVDLYERFEAAWRVTDATTLFDYGPGKSTRSFTLESWPIENPQTCQAPRFFPEGRPEPKAPLQALPETAAQQACAGIVANDRKANCIKDVMVTGDAQFATTYLLTDGIERNASPSVPTLTSPQDYYDSNKTDLALPVTFTWNTASDPDGDVVTYRHCVWVFGQIPDNNKCVPTTVQGTARRKAAFWITLLILIICLLLLLFLLLVRRQRKPVLLILLAVVILVSASVAIYLRRTTARAGTVAKTMSELQPGKDYSWKVIAEDGKGGISESETHRFKMK
ncbi:MAG TPA: hypothetical protein VFR51_08685 [Pyrinomonadaceae bacterium]|nr:hypothetical protein [Pyrinomonadaceae bacterium]